MSNGKISRIFTSREISGGTSPRVKRFLRGAFAKGIAKIGKYLSYTSLKSYGAFLLSFGLVTLLLNLGKYYILDNPTIAPSVLAVGIVLFAVGIPLLFFDKPMCIALQDFPLTDYLLFEFLSIKRVNRIQNPPSIPIIVSVFLGTIPASLGFLFSLEYVLLALLVFIIVAISFTSLEFPTILTLIIAPYLSFTPYKVYIMAAMSVFAFIGYLVRVVIGKRSYHLDFYGVAILLFGIVFTVSGMLGKGEESGMNAWLYLALLLGYFPASGLVVNRRLTDSAIKAIVFATLPISVYALVTDAINIINNGFTAMQFYYGAEAGGEKSFVISAYLLISALFTFMFFLEKNKKIKRVFYALFFLINLISIATICQLSVIIALFMSLFLALLAFKNSKIGYAIFPFTVLPYLIPLLPGAYLDKISGIFNLKTSLTEIASGLYRNVRLGIDNIIFGVGIGKDSYYAALGGVSERVDNIYVGVLSSIGVIALFILVIALVIKFIQTAVYSRYVKYSSVYVASTMCTVAVAALIMQGAFGNIFEFAELFYMFFVIFGISTATLRVAKKETDDRLNYYGDARSSETSSIDVNIV